MDRYRYRYITKPPTTTLVKGMVKLHQAKRAMVITVYLIPTLGNQYIVEKIVANLHSHPSRIGKWLRVERVARVLAEAPTVKCAFPKHP